MATFTVNLLLQTTVEAEGEEEARSAAFAEAGAKLESRGLSCLHIDSVEREEPQTCFEVEVHTTLVVPASSRQEAEEIALKLVVEDVQQDVYILRADATGEVPCFA